MTLSIMFKEVELYCVKEEKKNRSFFLFIRLEIGFPFQSVIYIKSETLDISETTLMS